MSVASLTLRSDLVAALGAAATAADVALDIEGGRPALALGALLDLPGTVRLAELAALEALPLPPRQPAPDSSASSMLLSPHSIEDRVLGRGRVVLRNVRSLFAGARDGKHDMPTVQGVTAGIVVRALHEPPPAATRAIDRARIERERADATAALAAQIALPLAELFRRAMKLVRAELTLLRESITDDLRALGDDAARLELLDQTVLRATAHRARELHERCAVSLAACFAEALSRELRELPAALERATTFAKALGIETAAGESVSGSESESASVSESVSDRFLRGRVSAWLGVGGPLAAGLEAGEQIVIALAEDELGLLRSLVESAEELREGEVVE